MFEGLTIWDILRFGGFTIWILILCSVLSIAVMIQKILSFRRLSRTGRRTFMDQLRPELQKKKFDSAAALCRGTQAPFASVALSGIDLHGEKPDRLSGAMDRQISSEINLLEKNLIVLGTIGSVAVYIGLFGTVIGIIRAFHSLSSGAGGGINVVIGGVAEALVSTAAGILVAVPAVVAYNYFIKRIEDFTLDMEITSSEIVDILKK